MAFFKQLKMAINFVAAAAKDFFAYINVVLIAIFLTMVYIVAVGTTFIAARLFARHFLKMKIDKNVPSYWEDFESTESIKKNIYRQF